MNQHRVILETRTDTIRLQPENYCLAYRRIGQWRLFLDEAANVPYRNLIIASILQVGEVSNGEALAKTLDAAVKESEGYL